MTDAPLPGGETRPPGTVRRPASDGSKTASAPRPRLLRGLACGLAMAAAFVVAWVVLAAILDVTVGLVVLAAAAGWLTGTAVALGAEPGTVRRRRSTVLLAVMVSVGIWLVGSYAAYVASLAILPASSLDLMGRMANAPFLDVISATFIPGGPLALLALALFGWLGAR